MSFPSTDTAAAPESSPTVRESSPATGWSFTALIWTVTVPVSVPPWPSLIV